jgi:hypothetical protein
VFITGRYHPDNLQTRERIPPVAFKVNPVAGAFTGWTYSSFIVVVEMPFASLDQQESSAEVVFM